MRDTGPTALSGHLWLITMSLSNAALQSVVLALYAWEGGMAWPALAALVPAALGFPLAYALLVHSDWNRRLQARAMLNAAAGDERLRESERISRELHDTLLQGVQGLVLRFQTAADRIPPGSPARHIMDEALARADEVLAEGRDRLGARCHLG